MNKEAMEITRLGDALPLAVARDKVSDLEYEW